MRLKRSSQNIKTLGVVALGCSLSLASFSQVPSAKVDHRFVSRWWFEVDSSPLKFFEDSGNPENNYSRLFGTGEIAGYEIGCMDMVSERPVVRTIVFETMRPDRKDVLPRYTRLMIESAALNLCGEGGRLAIVSVSFVDRARWSLYLDKRPERSPAEFIDPTTWWRAREPKPKQD